MLAVGCGSNAKARPDAYVTPDATPLVCDYTEAHDTTNDYNVLNPGFEQAGIVLPTGKMTICGMVNNGHFGSDTISDSIDIDTYAVTVAQDADVWVSLTGSGSAGSAALAAIPNLGIFAYDATTMVTVGGEGGGLFFYDHSVYSAHLPAGSYLFSMEAYGTGDIAASVPYKMTITTDTPATRCPQLATAPDYTESHDGPSDNGNDVVAVDYTATPQYSLITGTTNAPEPTNLTLASGTNYLIDGTSAAVAKNASYFDRDTYLITTGPTTDQLAIRLNWPSATVDLNWLMFVENDVRAPFAEGWIKQLGQPQFETFAVAPSSRYWLWIGASSTDSTNLPATYGASICAEAFTP
jgi:hypothetical protein